MQHLSLKNPVNLIGITSSTLWLSEENNTDKNEKNTEYLDESYDDDAKTDQVEED